MHQKTDNSSISILSKLKKYFAVAKGQVTKIHAYSNKLNGQAGRHFQCASN